MNNRAIPGRKSTSARARLRALSSVGLSTVEYVIILVLIAAVSVSTWTLFGSRIKSWLGSGSDQIDEQMKTANGGGRNREPLPRDNAGH